ncbi:MAG: hypothetical protein COA58_08225 [Bacteroidetes bacterium]|nr:MAG: hypothetical protein COA58_08225 [Bacteroidota bacterium]
MRKIQIVEDEVAIAMDLEMNLDMLGYEVSGHAVSYEEALELYRTNKPDLVLMDINLFGDKTGIDVANWIKENGNTPVVFLTAFNDATTFNNAINTEPYGYIIKPFTADDLRIHIEIALKRSESLLDARAYFQAIFANATQGIVIFANGKKVYSNTVFDKFEFNFQELAGLDVGVRDITIEGNNHLVEVLEARLDKVYSIVSFGRHNDSEWSENIEEKFLFVKDRGEYHRIVFSDIFWLEALDNYTNIYTCTSKFTIHGYLSDFESRLDDSFVRVHRSHILAVNRVDRIEGHTAICGDLQIPISRTRKEVLVGLLKS